MSGDLQAFFLSAERAGSGERFCLYHPARGRPHGAYVYVHPFAEEMNKSRRMAALQARGLANDGFAVLQIDLLGCGDSAGDFGDATWDDWVDDVLLALRWLQQRHDGALGVWGLRAGALLASAAARRWTSPLDVLFWQPVGAGKTVLTQFLRLRTAAAMLSGDAQRSSGDTRALLAAGETVEIAGYRISPALADGLERARLESPSAVGRCVWLEVGQQDGGELSPATARLSESWRSAAASFHATSVTGPAFWQTQEIEDAPQLIAATGRLVREAAKLDAGAMA